MFQATEAVKETEEEAGWNLEDESGFDDDEEAEGQAQPSTKPSADPKAEEGAMDLEEGGDEIDPLDAFMADNEVKVGPSVKTEDTAVAPKGSCYTLFPQALVPCVAYTSQVLHSNHFVHCCTAPRYVHPLESLSG